MKQLYPIHKATMKKIARTQGSWEGHIAPSNVNSFHVTDGWHIGMPIHIKYENDEYVVHSQDQTMELESYLRNYAWYNCVEELGKRVRFWTENYQEVSK